MWHSTNVSQMIVCRPANRINIIIKTKELIKYYSQIPFEDCSIILSPTYTAKLLKSCFACGYLKTINSVLESLIFNLLLIIHTLISEMQLFNLGNDVKGLLHLNEI